MASLMNELLEVLENEEAGYRELVEASTRKKEVIIKADIRALEEITAEEQEIAGKIKNIENKRISIMEDIANVFKSQAGGLDGRCPVRNISESAKGAGTISQDPLTVKRYPDRNEEYQ